MSLLLVRRETQGTLSGPTRAIPEPEAWSRHKSVTPVQEASAEVFLESRRWGDRSREAPSLPLSLFRNDGPGRLSLCRAPVACPDSG